MAFRIADEGMMFPGLFGSLGAVNVPVGGGGGVLLQRCLRPCLELCPNQACGEDGGMVDGW